MSRGEEWRMLHKTEVRNLYTCLSLFRMSKPNEFWLILHLSNGMRREYWWKTTLGN